MLPLTGLVTTANMALQSTGQSLPATVLAMSRQGIFFLPLIAVLPRFLGLWGIVLAQPLSDFITFFIALFLFRYFLKMLKENVVQ